MTAVEITLTDACNLNCRYCYEKNHNPSAMSEEMLLSLVDESVDSCSQGERLTVNLFGGEPFLQFDLIKSACMRLREKGGSVDWELGIITNGTLVHGAIKKWIVENADRVVVTLSLDGIKEVQNRNRGGSFDLIDVEFFSRLERPYVKMTVTPENLPLLFESLTFLHRKSFKINCTLAYGFKWREADFVLFGGQLSKYFKWAFENGYSGDDCSLLYFPYMLMEQCVGRRYRFCDIGANRTFNVDGSVAPCHMFLTNGLSEEERVAIKNIEFPDAVLTESQIDPNCKKCPLVTVCQSCYANNYWVNGDIYLQDEDICRANKILFKKKSEFAAMLWKRGLLLEEEEEKALINAVLMCQEMKCE